MNTGRGQLVPRGARGYCVLPLMLALGGCFGPDVSPQAEALVGTTPEVSPERAQAKAEIRRLAEATDDMPFPDAFESGRAARLSARGEPRPAPDAQALQAELAAIAVLQQTATTPEEIAELQARAAALQQLSLEGQAGRARR